MFEITPRMALAAHLPYQDLVCDPPARRSRAFCSSNECLGEPRDPRRIGGLYRVRGMGRAVEVFGARGHECPSCRHAIMWTNSYEPITKEAAS